MKYPNHITSLAMHNLVDCQKEVNGNWVPCRPTGYPSFMNRFRLAWMVFIGKADALEWPNQ